MAQHGFDVTHFGTRETWEKLCKELALTLADPQPDPMKFRWTNPRGLIVDTQCNPISGVYAPGNKEDEPGFASYIGIEGPDYEVAICAVAIRRHALFVKDERAGVRAYI